jgi:hypothetical protein
MNGVEAGLKTPLAMSCLDIAIGFGMGLASFVLALILLSMAFLGCFVAEGGCGHREGLMVVGVFFGAWAIGSVVGVFAAKLSKAVQRKRCSSIQGSNT